MSARTVIVVLLLVSLVACKKTERTSTTTQSGATSTAAAKKWGTNGPCSWLTDAEASEAVGQTSKQVIDPTTNNCNIEPVHLYYHVSDNTGAYSFMKAAKSAQDVNGIGDNAVWDTGSLAVVKGTRCVNIGVSSSSVKKADFTELKPKELALATKIVDRM